MAKISDQYNESTRWQDLSLACDVFVPATSAEFRTGDWRTDVPVFDAEKCKQCLLCTPVCPDSSIPVKDGKRLDFDFDHHERR